MTLPLEIFWEQQQLTSWRSEQELHLMNRYGTYILAQV
tara:strand:+ start:75 stop:188 length:114 start_codon:yes stop_codon:yes gene_type:complete